MSGLLSTAGPWDIVAEGYAETTSKLFEAYAEEAINIAGTGADSKVLDVACGPGTLPFLLCDKVDSIDAIDFSNAMVDLFAGAIKQRGVKNIEVVCGDAQSLPYESNRFDAAFSMFGLMFFPERDKGYAEILRTLKPGGRVVISSWAPVADSPAMQLMFGAVRAMRPDIPEPQAVIDSLENPDFFQSELEAAGFNDVVIHRVSAEYLITSAEDLWFELVRGSAPIAMMKKSMSEDEWCRKEQVALTFLNENLVELPCHLGSVAWLGTGTKPV